MDRKLTSLVLIAFIATLCANASAAIYTGPCDIDGDGDVDLMDFALLKDLFGSPGEDPLDFNGDGRVDLDDFIIFKQAFTGSTDGIPVPCWAGLALDVTNPEEAFLVNNSENPIPMEGYSVYSTSGILADTEFYGFGGYATDDPVWLMTTFGAEAFSFGLMENSEFCVTECTLGSPVILQPGCRLSLGDIAPNGIEGMTLTYLSDGFVYASETRLVCKWPGDANEDGRVDLEDFVILKNTFGQDPLVDDRADFDLDGDVDMEDFVILKRNFGWAI